jgi:sugar lactone lactonase YvrE
MEPVPGNATTWDVAAAGDLVRFDLTCGHEVTRIQVSDRFPDVRTNDTLRDPAGRVLVGLFTEDRASRHGGIVAADPQLGTVRTVVTGMVTANGLALNRAATRLYAVDTARGVLVRHHYDVRTGAVGPGVVLVRHHGPGKLDGLLVLDDDSLLVAVWDEGVLRRHDPEGQLLEVLRVPAARPTALAIVPAPHPGVVLTTAASTGGDHAGGPPTGGRLYWTEPIR